MKSTSIVVDLSFGDQGKGTIVDALARRCPTPPLVVRFNGGAQAGHNVHTSDGLHHTFSQFGAGSFVPGARTLLSKYMVMHPPGLLREAERLEALGAWNPLGTLMVDERALIITPYHQALNRLRERARGKDRHGTCGLGVGETVGDSLAYPHLAIRVQDLRDRDTLQMKLGLIRDMKMLEAGDLAPNVVLGTIGYELDGFFQSVQSLTDSLVSIGERLTILSPDEVEFQVRESEHVIFEGAQGVLLDEWYGFHPHTTWSTTTTENALAMIVEAGREGPVRGIGVLRAYATRHGQGPFPSEDENLTKILREKTNADDGWQGSFRVGWFDAVLSRYAISLCPGLTELAVTCLDRLAEFRPTICAAYEDEDEELFYLKGREVSGIRVGKKGDLDRQERLGKVISKVRKRLVPYESEAEFLRGLDSYLGLPIAIRSYGPTAEDKRWTA